MSDPSEGLLNPENILNSMPSPVIIIDENDRISYINLAAENFFRISASALIDADLQELVPHDSPLLSLVGKVRKSQSSMTEYGVHISTPRIGNHLVSIDAAPMMWSNRSATKSTLLIFLEQKIAGKINDSMNQRGVSRSVGALAMMLAHEVKNPLSGIRGAAQLLETIVPAEERQLTKLITEETDRIVKLVDRMEVFSDNPHLDRQGVNIHEILDHVIRVSKSGFARDVTIDRHYDPSLPDVHGNRDQLIQVFINLIKNASEAIENSDGNIIVTTEFRHGVRLAVPGVESRMHLPLVVSITDNGPGIADDIKAHLFDPFITTKRGGSGLGLALVAKLVGDQGGVIEVDTHPGKTTFSIMLPMYKAQTL